MTDQIPVLTSDTALTMLCDKVAADTTLSQAIKTAFLTDMKEQNPAALTNLKAAMKGEGQCNEADCAQGK
ncbi:MAG: hypothetical protein HQK96_00220 [Nitrospirae bacterium]|nr:hypothetical protein [Nitrospirota bacterium]